MNIDIAVLLGAGERLEIVILIDADGDAAVLSHLGGIGTVGCSL